jgi:hypothetical protein
VIKGRSLSEISWFFLQLINDFNVFMLYQWIEVELGSRKDEMELCKCLSNEVHLFYKATGLIRNSGIQGREKSPNCFLKRFSLRIVKLRIGSTRMNGLRDRRNIFKSRFDEMIARCIPNQGLKGRMSVNELIVYLPSYPRVIFVYSLLKYEMYSDKNWNECKNWWYLCWKEWNISTELWNQVV